ncbi:MAG TPA: hypothetical protein DHV28_07840 [Ignavibacteriales bacterium]|nr:hypothetical protein [Ignavibacteriales bacterium]
MLNRIQIRNVVEKTMQINAFNLQEYQDKYYFQKKVQEELLELSDKEIYFAIDKFLSNSSMPNKKSFDGLVDELFNVYLTKANDSSRR